MSLESVRGGLRDAYRAVHPKWHTYSVWDDITQLPAMLVLPTFGGSSDGPPAKYGRDFAGSVQWNLRMMILVERADAASADRTLSALVSPDNELSVPAILNRHNRELRRSGVGYVICEELSAYGKEYSVAGTTAVGAEFIVKVEKE